MEEKFNIKISEKMFYILSDIIESLLNKNFKEAHNLVDINFDEINAFFGYCQEKLEFKLLEDIIKNSLEKDNANIPSSNELDNWFNSDPYIKD